MVFSRVWACKCTDCLLNCFFQSCVTLRNYLKDVSFNTLLSELFEVMVSVVMTEAFIFGTVIFGVGSWFFFFKQYILFYSELGIMSNIPIQWEMLKTTVASVSDSLISQLCSVTQEIKTCFWLPLVCLFFSPKICPFSSQKKKINAIQLWKPGRGLAFSDQEN